MNKQKYLISSISMVMMIFLVGFYQFIKLSSLSFLEQTSATNEIGFILLSVAMIIVVAIVSYYIPMLLIFEFKVKFNISFTPDNYISNQNYVLYNSIKIISRRYLRLNVIRC